MKKILLTIAWLGALSTQALEASTGLAPAPVITGISIAAYEKPWDMVRDLLTKQPRCVARSQISFPVKALIIPGIVAAVAITATKILVERLFLGNDIWGYNRTTPHLDREGFDKDGVGASGFTYENRDGEILTKNVQGEDVYYTYTDKHRLNNEYDPSLWQSFRWAIGSRVKNPWNWLVSPLVALGTGAIALTPTFWRMYKDYAKNFAAEQEKQVDRIVDVWKDAKPFFPEELHNAFDTLQELKTKKSPLYETSRTRVVDLMRRGCKICPAV